LHAKSPLRRHSGTLAHAGLFCLEQRRRKFSPQARSSPRAVAPMNRRKRLTDERPTITHTYRDPDVFKGRFDGLAALAVCAFITAFLFGPIAFGWVPFTWTWAAACGVSCGFVFAGQYVLYRRQTYGSCAEIRLGDDGTCELETKREVIRLHVHDLRSVRYSRETDDRVESYTIHYRSGKLHVGKGMTGFGDFLSRLRTLNPAVELTGFPTNAWSALGQPATKERGTLLGLFIRSALFPLIVISLLVYLASQTLVK
jgi:hypothetical protein